MMMRTHHNRNNAAGVKRRLVTLSPKTVAAVALMTLMCLLWVRVLTRSAAPTAHAAETAKEATPASSATPVTVVPLSLPTVAGRHDGLRRDFFSPGNWPGLGRAETGHRADSGDDGRQRRLATFFKSLEKTLTLDAIMHAGGDLPMHISIDGKVLSQGQTLPVNDETETYELTVSEIGRQQVVLTWDQWSVVLSMAQPEDGD